MRLAHLAMPDEGGAMGRCQEVRQEIYESMTEECQEAMCITTGQVMQDRRGMLASPLER